MNDHKTYTQHLGMDHVELLKGTPISLTSEFGDNKVLSTNRLGELGFELQSDGANQLDQKWKLIKQKNPDLESVIVVSEKLNKMVCHDINDEFNVYTRPLSPFTDGCEWNIGKKGELYYKDPFDVERYLWVANDKVYSTNDGYIAEQWIPFSNVERHKNANSFSNMGVVWKVLVILILGYLGYKIIISK